MFTLKKLMAAFVAPLPLALLLLFVALLLFLLKKKEKLAFTLTASSFLLILFASTPWLSMPIVKKLENIHPHLFVQAIPTGIRHIVVLGCAHKNDEPMPITSQLAHCSLARTVEAVRVAHHLQNSELIFTGYNDTESVANAVMNKALAIDLGIAESRIKVFSQPKDTKEEAQAIQYYLAKRPFILVTEASHMPRAMRYFQAAGLNPIAKTTRHLQTDLDNLTLKQVAPSARWLKQTERVWYEALGLIYQATFD